MLRKVRPLLPLAAALVLAAAARADAEPASPDKTLSPYFVVENGDPNVERLPLESTQADVHIAGVISDVKVTQTYRNDGDRTISARYVFPASTRAAVHAMKMTVGDRVIVAAIKERGEAKAEYDAAKQAGKTATLLEEDRPNVFTMSVANILPKDRIQVELDYTELLVPTDGVYELVYPTTVLPRYVSEATQAAQVAAPSPLNQFLATPYQHAGDPPTSTFDIHVTLGAGMPIQAVDSPSHKIATQLAANRQSATVALDPTETAAGNRDFVLRYALAGADLASGLMLYQGSDTSYFLAMVQPPQRPAPDLVPPREYVFIVDVSGSMEGFPLHTAQTLMHDLLARLRPTDRFDVLLFSGSTELFAREPVPADADQIGRAVLFVQNHASAGGTELLPALETASGLPHQAGMSRSVVVVTDGGIAEEPKVFEHIRAHLGTDNVFSFGIGTSVNRHLMEGIAKAGQGEAFIVERDQDAAGAAAKFERYVDAPVLTHVSATFAGLDVYDVQPSALPDVFASRPVVLFGKYRGAPRGTLTLAGTSGRGAFHTTLDVATAAPSDDNHALEQLWARMKISELSDFYNDDANQQAVTELGLKYHLLTKFTSFIAVHQQIRATSDSTDVAQPLPLPQGVSDAAVASASAGEMAVGAEPPLWIALVLVGVVLAAKRSHRRSFA